MENKKIIKQTTKLFLAGLLTFGMFGCSGNNNTNENTGKSKEEIILAACEKIKNAKSYDIEYLFEASPANEYYQYSKTTLEGTMSDVQNLVFEGHYHDEMLIDKDNKDNSDNEIYDGPITKKAGEDGIIPAEYNDGHEMHLDEDIMRSYAEPYVFVSTNYEESELLEYEIKEEEIEDGKRYTIHAVLKLLSDDETQEYESTEDCIYELNNEGYLVFVKQKSNSPLLTSENKITDINRTTLTQWKFSNIK